VVLLLIFGFGRNQWRKRKYARKQLSWWKRTYYMLLY
jgi:hypothetical protein